MALKILKSKITTEGDDCVGSQSDAILALEYVQKNADEMNIMDIKCTNNSWGGEHSEDADLANAIQTEANKGRLFIVAAGNDRRKNNDVLPYYPANYDSDNVISVCSVEHNGTLSDFSNFGKENVDLCALGRRIKSTYPNNKYSKDSGTSMATPYVTGTVAVLWSTFPDLSISELKTHLLASVESIPALKEANLTGGRLSLRNAISYMQLRRQTFTISNIGETPLNVDKVEITGENAAEFEIRSDKCLSKQLVQSEYCTVEVFFAPTTTGNKKALLAVTSNTPVLQTTSVNLSGKLENITITSLDISINEPPSPPQSLSTDLAEPSVYDIKTGALEIPTIILQESQEDIGVVRETSTIDEAKLSLIGNEPLRFKVDNYGTPGILIRKIGAPTFDVTTGILNIPFLKVGTNTQTFYEVDMGIVLSSDGKFEFELREAIPIH